jgi:hypothetical protein
LDDVEALEMILAAMKDVSHSTLSHNHAVSFDSAISRLDYQIKSKQNMQTLQVLVENKILSESMAKKAASSGLRMNHLKMASKRSEMGITELFSELNSENKPRATASKMITDKVQSYISAM